MSTIRALLTAVLIATISIATSLHGQSPALTNADVIRLVAMHLPDQTVIAVINETKATQFDLSPSALNELMVKGISPGVIAAMRQSSAPTVASTAHLQTLAEAAAEAAQIVHSWPQSTNTASSSQTAAPAPSTSTSEGAKSEGTTTVTKSGVKDEAYWRDRMRTLRASCQAKAAAVKSFEDIEKKKVADARKELAASCPSCPQTAEIKVTLPAVIQVEIEKAKADFSACNATISIVEEEARVAGVPPGWLRER